MAFPTRAGAAALILAVLSGSPLDAQTTQSDSTRIIWNRPIAPFRIVGNLYYVGAQGVSSFLITSPQGHVLIDGGLAETAPQILAGIAQLGFRAGDVKVLLNSHGHYDHAEGLLAIQQATGAPVYAAPGDADLIERGGIRDFAYGDRFPYTAFRVARRLADGDTVRVGPTAIRVLLTPGHTMGCPSFVTTIRDGGRDYSVVIACSLTAPGGYRLRENPAFPNIYESFLTSMRRLGELQPDIWLTSHGMVFDLVGKRARMADGAPNPFMDDAGYRAWLMRSEAAIRAEFARQSNGRQPGS